jgi:hypothetical protein
MVQVVTHYVVEMAFAADEAYGHVRLRLPSVEAYLTEHDAGVYRFGWVPTAETNSFADAVRKAVRDFWLDVAAAGRYLEPKLRALLGGDAPGAATFAGAVDFMTDADWAKYGLRRFEDGAPEASVTFDWDEPIVDLDLPDTGGAAMNRPS